MDNIIYGIPTVILCFIGYFFSWQCAYKDKNYNTALFLLILCGFLLRIYVSTDFFLHEWDEKFHALVAKNLIKHPLKPTLYDHPILPYDYKDWGHNHIWLHKPPLALWLMALSLKLFGINEIALRLPSIILSALSILFTYQIAQKLFDEKIAYFSALLFSMNGFIIELTGGRTTTDHIDIAFQFFILLAILLAVHFSKERKSYLNIFCGIAIGLAVLTKWLPALIVLPIWLVLNYKNFSKLQLLKHFIILITITALVFLPWQFFIFTHYPLEAKWEAAYNLQHITQVVEEHKGTWYYYLDKVRINYNDLIYLPLLWFIIRLCKHLFDKRLSALALWVFVPLVFFSFVKTKMPGYLLFTSSGYFIISSLFINELSSSKKIFNTLSIRSLMTISIIFLSTRYCIERIKPFSKENRNPQWVVQLKDIEKSVNAKTIIFNHPHPLAGMFYTDATFYEHIPSKEVLDSLKGQGYNVYLYNDFQSSFLKK